MGELDFRIPALRTEAADGAFDKPAEEELFVNDLATEAPEHVDPFGRPGGPYADAEVLVAQERINAERECREPNFDPDHLDPFNRIPRG